MNTNHAPLDNPCNDKYTLSAWFKVSGGFGPLLVTHYDAQSTGIWLESLGSGLQYGTPNGTNTIYDWPVDKDTSFTDGEWHHIAATFDHAAGANVISIIVIIFLSLQVVLSSASPFLPWELLNDRVEVSFQVACERYD